MLRVLDLFAGIGGFSLGLERTGGFRTVAFCENNPFCRRVLARHWQGVPIYEDVRSLRSADLERDGISVDVITGGFPCQDISSAGNGLGLSGARSGLWREFARIIGDVRPRFAIVENVSALLHRGMGEVLGDLAALGFDAEWHCVPAAAVGAPHRRDRVWLVAYSDTVRRGFIRKSEHGNEPSALGTVAHGLDSARRRSRPDVVSDAVRARSAARISGSNERQEGDSEELIDGRYRRRRRSIGDAWSTEPAIRRVASGIPHRFHRLSALGNAVVPQIAQIIGEAILEAIRGEP